MQALNGPCGSIASSFLQVAPGWNLSYRTFGLCLAEGGPAPADSFSAGRLLPLDTSACAWAATCITQAESVQGYNTVV